MRNSILNKSNYRLIRNLVKWNFNYYFNKKPSPLIAAFRLTNKCNLACQMCSIWQDKDKKIFDFTRFRKIVKELGQVGCCYITLSGGEPLLVQGISDYVKEVKKNKIFANLVTNGLLVKSGLVEQLSEAGLDTISISIDGLEITNDIIRGNGMFKNAVSAIEKIKTCAPQIKIVVNTVISPWNIDEIIQMCDFLTKKGVCFKFQPIYNHPETKEQTDGQREWEVNEEFVVKCKRVVDRLITRKDVINSKYFLRAIPDYFSNKLSGKIFDGTCYTGYYYCEFKENEYIFPCIEGMGWDSGIDMGNNELLTFIKSKRYVGVVKKLSDCRRCKEILTICYAEPKFILPLHNYLYTKLIYNQE
jgi:MoaA/NifB/PqqE/SkfB family radical SAM enzyme